MSSVSVAFEVLAVLGVLIVVAVACCCIGFCMFHIMDQEMLRTERMMIGDMQPDDNRHIGATSIQMIYDPEEYKNNEQNVQQGQNGQMVQNNGNVLDSLMRQFHMHQLNYQAGTTTTEITITNTISTQPTQPTQPTESTPTHVYTDSHTQRLAGARQPVFTTTDNSQTQQSQQPQQSQQTEKSPVVVNDPDDVEQNITNGHSKENHRKIFTDSSQETKKTHKTHETQETQQTKGAKETLEVETKQQSEFGASVLAELDREPVMRYRKLKPYTPVFVMMKEHGDNFTYDEYLKKYPHENNNISDNNDSDGPTIQLGKDEEYAWELIRERQRAFINAEQDEPNLISLISKKTN